jgi:penicillin-binding protein 1B
MAAAMRARRIALYAALAVPLAALAYGVWVWGRIAREFDDRAWNMPARVFAAPLELHVGRQLTASELALELQRLGYGPVSGRVATGLFRREGNTIEVGRRAFVYDGRAEPERSLRIEIRNDRIGSLTDGSRNALPIAQLEPLLIGNIFASHGEDRLVLSPGEVPKLLTEALKAVEDRRFDSHSGIDARAMLRAALANARAGGIEQGGSTLTMQLVRSYFLSNRQTYTRKVREALMSLVLELRHEKDEIMLAYVNEIYLGQDGSRAVHGFGLASRFYFGKPLAELEVHEIALLVAIVRGPSFYDPRRNPERALARRTLVLEQMRSAGLITAEEFEANRERPLGVITQRGRRAAYYPAFIDLVRRQIASDYDDQELGEGGLSIYTTLDPVVQAASEEALVAELERLQAGRPPLEGAVIVTSPQNAEVLALVGGKRVGFEGFNRALDARRQIGSLIKPFVYLAALETGDYSLATQLDDAPITVELDNGRTWTPQNLDKQQHGQVTAARALAESLNLATVQLGMEVGLPRVARVLERLGVERAGPLYPSLLLGALELTPYEVARLYSALANGGFQVPLRTVRAIVDGEGRELQRYSLALQPVADPVAVYALNQGLVQVMERGTGATARRLLPDGFRAAGKTGTSDGSRDSWFAGFSNERLVVAWVGNDGNADVGLTGGTGAAQIWARIMRSVDATSYDPPAPEGAENLWIDFETGLATDSDCPNAVYLAVAERAVPPKAVDCGSARTRVGSRIRQWFRNRLSDGVF